MFEIDITTVEPVHIALGITASVFALVAEAALGSFCCLGQRFNINTIYLIYFPTVDIAMDLL